jgi:hypothetical protein
LASCCAFFLSLQARLASLFFSLRDFVLQTETKKNHENPVLRIPDPDFLPSWIPEPQDQKRGEFFYHFFLVEN